MLCPGALATYYSDHLNQINSINSHFLSVSVSGMDSGSLLCGRPYGGCTILYRKSYAPCITPISSCSQRFVVLKFSILVDYHFC